MAREEKLDLFAHMPDRPTPTDEAMSRFKSDDWVENFFEWHRTVGSLAFLFATVQRESSALRRVDRLKFVILTALLSRCGRLMMGNLCLATDDRHGDAMTVIDRALNETAIKIIWLCRSRKPDRFRRFLADGLRNDLEFEAIIRNSISARGHKLIIEDRMLASIRNTISTARMSRQAVRRTKRLPDLASMMRDIGLGDLSYTVVQRMGSHYVHGTWSALLMQTMERGEDGKPRLKDGFNRAHVNQLMFGSRLVLVAIHSFAKFVTKRANRTKVLLQLDSFIDELDHQNYAMASPDFARK